MSRRKGVELSRHPRGRNRGTPQGPASWWLIGIASVVAFTVLGACDQPLSLPPSQLFQPEAEVTVETSPDGTGSVEVVYDRSILRVGDVVDLRATPGDGWVFAGWSGSYTGSDNPVSVAVGSRVRYVALFERAVYPVVVRSGDGGSVEWKVTAPTEGGVAAQDGAAPSDSASPSTEGVTVGSHAAESDAVAPAMYPHGTELVLTVVPDVGYAFAGWSGQAEGQSLEIDRTITEPLSLTASFVPLAYTIATSVIGDGRIELAGDLDAHRHGAVVSASAVPKDGYRFSHWDGDATGVANPTSIVMTSDRQVTAVFEQSQYRVTSAVDGSGTIEQSLLDGTPLVHNGRIAFHALPESGWHFVGWTETTSGVDSAHHENPLTLVATGDVDITATFEQTRRNVYAETHGSGTVGVVPDDGSEHLLDGTRARISAIADPGWIFSRWEGDLSGTLNPRTLTIDGDLSLTAVFHRSQYRFNSFTAGEGSVETTLLDGESLVHGGRVRLEAVPSAGWEFLRWTGLPGEAAASSEAGTNPAGTAAGAATTNPVVVTAVGDMEVTAEFGRVERQVTVTAVGGGSAAAAPLGEGRLVDGSRVQLTAAADPGWIFSRWDGGVVTSANPATHTLDGDLAATAVFTESAYRVVAFTAGEGSVETTLLDGESLVHGGRVRLEAVPSAGWEFLRWTGLPGEAAASSEGGTDPAGDTNSAGAATTNPVVVTAVGDMEVTAEFGQTPIQVEVSTQGRGVAEVAVVDGSDGYYHGTRIRVSATADTGWAFSHWDGNIGGSLNPHFLTLEGPVTATAVFRQMEFDVDTAVVGAGSVATSFSGEVNGFARVLLTATADAGWEFLAWSGHATGTGSSIGLTLDADKRVTAEFVPTVYRISGEIQGNGEVHEEVEEGGSPVLGSHVRLSPEPSQGWSFSHWGNDFSDNDTPKIVGVDGDVEYTATFIKNVWTILLYMGGDNELEANMLEDINELEAVDLSGLGVHVLVLADRAEGHSTASGDWTGTRLYRVTHDPEGDNRSIVSQRLASMELGVSAVGDTVELNLGSDETLSAFLDFADRAYEAEHTALVIWGHGGGYRSASSDRFLVPAARVGSVNVPREPAAVPYGSKALSVDAGSGGDLLLTPELGRALSGRSLDVVALDLCYGAMIEIAYEIRQNADTFVASQDAIHADGWEYDRFLSLFAAGPLTVDRFVSSSVGHFAQVFASSHRAAISALDLSRMDRVHGALNDFADIASAGIADDSTQRELRQAIFGDAVGFYETPGELGVDIASLVETVVGHVPAAAAAGDELRAALADAMLMEWHNPSGYASASGLSIHFVPLDGWGFPLPHADAYFGNESVSGALEFVQSSTWVPNRQDKSGLLYRLWYQVFE